MENKEKVTFCKLCLKSCNTSFVNVNESRGKILDAFFPRSNLKVSNVLCENCAENLQTCFEFRSNCLYIEECINSFISSDDNVKVDIKALYLNMNKSKDEVKIEEGYTACRLCMELSNSNCMLLKENEDGGLSVQMMVERCIPELNLNITEDPVICTCCSTSLYNYFNFLKSHSGIEEKVIKIQIKQSNVSEFSGNNIIGSKSNVADNQYEKKEDSKVIFDYKNCISVEPLESNIKIEEVDIKVINKGMVDERVLKYRSDHMNTINSSECSGNEIGEVEIKYENVEINDNDVNTDIQIDKGEVEIKLENASNCNSAYSDTFKGFHEKEINCEFKLEHFEETTETNIKPEDRELKTGDDTRFHRNPTSFQPELEPAAIHTDSLGVKLYKYGLYAYKAKHKSTLIGSYIPSHKRALQSTMHRCSMCNFETKFKANLKRHMLVHKDPSEIIFYSCEACDYKTKYTTSIKQHLLTHRHPSEATMHVCGVCEFKTKHRRSLRGHMLLHKSASERTLHKCEFCTYKAKRKNDIARHALLHKNDSDVTWYQCDMCEYKSKFIDRLKKHNVIHKDASEVILYHCPLCKYKTKYTSHLSRHVHIHKDVSERALFHCEICGLKTKYKTSLEKHMLLHKDAAEVTVYQCDTCEFKTRHKWSLKTHALYHKERSEVKIYECEVCPFKTKYKGSLKQHRIAHKKNISDNTELC